MKLLPALVLALATPLSAQVPAQVPAQPRYDLRGGLPVGSEAERYLRVLQVAGLAPQFPWTIRGFTPGQISRVMPADTVEHPWGAALSYDAPPRGEVEFGWVTPEAGLVANSGYPFGENDGALWAGRGFTGFATGGAWLRWGRLHVRIAPDAFVAQNAGFELAPNGRGLEEEFRDSRFPGNIDLPQRFGDAQYGQLGLGSSSIVLALPYLEFTASGAVQVWGPSETYPLLVGPNAGGFEHLLVQTARPLDIGIGTIHGRFLIGRLGQSDFSPAVPGTERRFVSAITLDLLPRGLSGLEFGVARFVDVAYPIDGISVEEILRPFSRGTSTGLATNSKQENQIAGAFLRWNVPSANLEVWMEFIREDFGRDVRHYIVEPEDQSARVFGLRRVFSRPKRMLALRGEVVAAETHHSERLDRYRGQMRPLAVYWHTGLRQGHTHKGQLLGSPAAYGGSGMTLGADIYDRTGRKTIELFRELRADWRRDLPDGTGIPDVLYGARLEMLRFMDGWELTASVSPMIDLNRNVVRGNDAFNLNVVFGARGLPW